MTEEKKLTVNEVALAVGVSTYTINNWYKWKKINPEDELAKLLPDFEQDSQYAPRYWKQSDIWSIMKFKENVPKGRNGFLGDVTQKYLKNKKEDNSNE